MNNRLRKLTNYILPLLVVCAVFAPALLFGQEAAAGAAAPGGAEVHTDTLWDTIRKGGWIMIPLGMCSVGGVWLVVDGVIRTTLSRVFPQNHVDQIRNLFKNGDYVGAYEYAKSNPSPFTDVVRAGLVFLPDGKNMTEEAVLSEISRVKATFDSRISYLSVLGVCTPMIGLIGTVVGMMGAFSTLGTSGIGDPSQLAGHIGEVLVATASGLFIAVPSFMAFFFLKNRVAKILHDMQEVVTNLLRKMPYEDFEGIQIGDEEIYAATPNWVAPAEEQAVPEVQA